MKVIALRGTPGSGKSHTMNILYQILLLNGFTQVPGHYRGLGNPKFEDILDVLQKEEQLVGYAGMGDIVKGPEGVAGLLHELEQKGCTVAFCCCRDQPGMVNAIRAYSSHVIIDKTSSTGPDNHRIVNNRDALQMYASI